MKYGLVDHANDIDLVVVRPKTAALLKIDELKEKFPVKKSKYDKRSNTVDASFQINGIKIDLWYKNNLKSLEIEGLHYGYLANIIAEKAKCDREKDWDQLKKIREALFPYPYL